MGKQIPKSADVIEQCRIEAESGSIPSFRGLTKEDVERILDELARETYGYSDQVTEVRVKKVSELVSLKIYAKDPFSKADAYNLGIGLLAKVKSRIDYPIVDRDIGVSNYCYVIDIEIERKRLFRKSKIEAMTGIKEPKFKRIVWK